MTVMSKNIKFIKISGVINGSFKHSNVQENSGNKIPLTAAVSVVVAISDRKYKRKDYTRNRRPQRQVF